MTNTSRRGGTAIFASIVATLALVGMLGISSSASAGTILCGGKVTEDREHDAENGLKYSFKCSEDISAYTVVSNREVSYFGTEVFPLAGSEVAEGESFTCEGAIPGNGIGCYGKMTAGHKAEAWAGLTEDVCTEPGARFWLVVASTQIAKEKPFTLTSEPFALKAPHCPPQRQEKPGKRKGKGKKGKGKHQGGKSKPKAEGGGRR